jgi:hypothetical protein
MGVEDMSWSMVDKKDIGKSYIITEYMTHNDVYIYRDVVVEKTELCGYGKVTGITYFQVVKA